ncbi:porin [Xanthobacter autotrophicus DSM 431]|uniref:porin n=1 Tax=Xanthobacter nonsaccharivorans TaxID=3119912 RepID=UPI00372BB13B
MRGVRYVLWVGAGVISGSACAADLPVKAKSVEYLKVCAAYGAGYFYIPGTDTCIKIGGLARFDAYVNAVGTFIPEIVSPSAATAFNGPGVGVFGYPFRDDDDPQYLTRARLVTEFDARTQTDYGTLRSYVRFGAEWNSQAGAGLGAGSALYFERAFIQFSGFTFGYTQSFFDPGLDYMMTVPFTGSYNWTTLAAYTAQFGGGLSATLSVEDAANRTTGVQLTGSTAQPVFNVNAATTGLSYTNFQAGQQVPDLVANIRLDQTWGAAQLSGALHQVAATSPLYAGFVPGVASSDKWGWAVGAHVEVKLPMISAGDSVFVQASYEQGGANFLGLSGAGQARSVAVGALDLQQVGGVLTTSGAFYNIADAVATNLFGDYSLTSGWALQAQYRHFWTPGLRSSFSLGYVSYQVPQNIVAAFDFNLYQAVFNTIWSPVKNIDIGFEVLYTKVDGSVPLGNYAAVGPTGAMQGSLVGGSTDIWSGGVRVQRAF